MENERRKQKYLDILRKTSSKGLNKDIGVLEVQYDSSSCFNENLNVEPKCEKNDLLAKVERYNKANPLSHISKDRLTRGLTIKRILHQRAGGFRSNINNEKNLENVYKFRDVHNPENLISFIKPKQNIADLKPNTLIEFGTPKATSTIKPQQAQYKSISSKRNDKSTTAVNINNQLSISREKMYDSECSSYNHLRPFTSSNAVKRVVQSVSSIMSDKKLNIKTPISIEDKAKLNLTYCLYLECVHANCDEIKNINENVFPNNEYSSINFKKQLKQIKLQHLNKQNMTDTNLTSTSNSDNNKSIDSFRNESSGSITNFNDFIFKPVINLAPNNSDTSRASQNTNDSFVCLTQETIFTSIENSMDIDQKYTEFNEELFSSSEIYRNENKNNSKYKNNSTHFQSSLTYFTNFASSSD